MGMPDSESQNLDHTPSMVERKSPKVGGEMILWPGLTPTGHGEARVSPKPCVYCLHYLKGPSMLGCAIPVVIGIWSAMIAGFKIFWDSEAASKYRNLEWVNYGWLFHPCS